MPRKKTVKLDRIKLERARIEQNIDKLTIAHRMQVAHPTVFDGEPPRRLVTRAFQEANILHANALYISEALRVPLSTLLYVTGPSADGQKVISNTEYEHVHDVAGADGAQEASPAGSHDRTTATKELAWPVASHARIGWSLGAAAAVTLVLGLWFTTVRPINTGSTHETAQQEFEQPASYAGSAQRYQLAVLVSGALGQPVRDAIERHFSRSPTDALHFVTNLGPPPDSDLADLPSALGAEHVVTIDAKTQGRHTAVSATLATDVETRRVWMEAAPTAELINAAEGLVQNTVAAIGKTLSIAAASSPHGTGTTQRKAFDEYVSARVLMESSGGGSADDLDAAFRSVQSAIDHDTEFALAYAVKCEVLTRLHWVDSTLSYLDSAGQACEQASARLADHPYVIAVNALRHVKAGQSQLALDLLEPAMVVHDKNVDLRMVAAEAHFSQRSQDNRQDAIDRAIDLLQEAAGLDPDYWAPHFWTGTYYFYSSRLQEAKTHLQKAAQLNRNQLTLANLGTVSLCIGDLATAERTYLLIIEDFPTNHMGPEMLAAVYHFNRRYEEEIGLRNTALQLLGRSQTPQIHQMHGSLGDAYRLLGQDALAIENYQAALDVLRRDKVTSVLDANDYTAIAYYSARIANLNDTLGDARQRAEIHRNLDQVDPAVLDVGAHVKSAQTRDLLGDRLEASAAWDSATKRCDVYRQHPDRRD